MWMKLIYPKWPKLAEQTEFHLPPHGPINFAAVVPRDIELTFVDENRTPLGLGDRPDVVALSVMLSCQLPRAMEIAAEYRRQGVPVIAGGIAVMLHADEMAKACDAVFLGEVEGHFDRVLADLRAHQLKRVYDCMHSLPATELIGTARRDILDYSHYTYRGVRMVDLVHASRGCRFDCDPCPAGFLGGHKFRPRPIDKVVEEVRSIDNGRLFFVDNSLAQDKAWVRELFTALLPLKRKWVSHPIEADPETLELAYRAGAWYVYQAIGGPIDMLRRRIKLYKEHGIGVEGTIILGTDEQDEDGVKRLVDFCIELDLDMAEFNVLTPFPHTKYRRQLQTEGRILHDRWIEYTGDRVVFQPKHMSPAKLQDLYFYAWETFYAAKNRRVRMSDLIRKVMERERSDGHWQQALPPTGDAEPRGWPADGAAGPPPGSTTD